jgi:hypothetical protein
MLDYDPCSLGPLTCNVGCRAESDVESVSVFSGYSRRSRMSVGTYNGEDTDPIDALVDRVALFQSKGWLSQQEYRRFSALLSTASPREDISPVTDMLLKDMEKELDTMEEKMNGGTLLRKQTRLTAVTPASSVAGPTGPRKPFGLFKSNAKTPSLLAASKKGNAQDGAAIVDPKTLSKEFGDDQLSELFVETCFFARLGFVQPPCCLQCTFRESLKGAAINASCSRWVIWRRDAKHVLHPNHLCDNAIAMRCHAARKLLSGKMVEQNKWDSINKVLVQPRSVKKFQPSMCAPGLENDYM